MSAKHYHHRPCEHALHGTWILLHLPWAHYVPAEFVNILTLYDIFNVIFHCSKAINNIDRKTGYEFQKHDILRQNKGIIVIYGRCHCSSLWQAFKWKYQKMSPNEQSEWMVSWVTMSSCWAFTLGIMPVTYTGHMLLLSI